MGKSSSAFKSNMTMSATKTFASALERKIIIGATRSLELKFLHKLSLKKKE